MDVFNALKDHNQKIQSILKALQEKHKETDFKTILNYVHKTDLLLTRELNKLAFRVEAPPRARPAARHLSEFKSPLKK
ncbi:MAG: hypothetical protein CMH46_00710 [Muricauda sp.]|nr:hypothetical protein [Allomuricauda sp.]|tara:strand:+ start:215 stop:448 length:234 start_codon:yes stop_codon:yes gene_type:complete